MLLSIKQIPYKFLILCAVLVTVFAQLNGANEVRKAIFHQYNDSSYIILHLYNFHPIGGSYEKGNERISGYNDSEILIYNLDSRKLIAQKKFGANNNESAIEMLGCSDSILWIYSMQYKSGLQGLNIFSLTKEISQARIYNKLSEWHGRFFDAKWNEINNYFGFDEINDNLFVTNYLNKQYYINPKNFIIKPFENQLSITPNKPKPLSKIIYSDKDTLNIFNNALHKNNLQQLPNTSFIEGSFIVEENKQKQFVDFSQLLLFYNKVLASTNETLSKIRVGKNSIAYKELIENKAWYEQQVKRTQENLNALNNNKKPDNLLLSSADDGFFIFHRNDKSDDSFIAISKVITDNNEFSVSWTIPVTGMFFNIQLARYTKAFKRFYGDFIPENSDLYIQEINNSLIIVFQMQICSINCDTGEINWRFKL